MLNDPGKESENEPIELRCYFVRNRNALAVRGDFATIYRDYYLHLMQHELRYESFQDNALKEAIAGLVLHLASRPRNEAIAWTLSWQEPPYNLFVTGSNRQGNVTGRIFTEDIRPRENNLFFSQTTADGEPSRQSNIEARAENFLAIVEDYYTQSEQRPARIFRYRDEDFVMVTAQPDCDLEWFRSLSNESIRKLDQNEELSLLETRSFRFDCGCSILKLLPVIGSLSTEERSDLFDEKPDQPVLVTCPRCGARYGLTRDMLDLYLEQENPGNGNT